MATLANLDVRLGLIDQLSGGLGKAENRLKQFGKTATNIGRKWTAAVTVPILGGLTFAVKAASDLNETVSKTEAVFGGSAKAVIAWSEDSATSMGLSQQAALETTATMGNLARGFDLTEGDAARFSQQMVQAAVDLGSFNNVPTDQVLADIQSGLVGQYEPLRKYGILLNEATVSERALAMGLAATTDELTEGDKALARQALIMDQLGASQGDFARTSGGLANQQRILRAQLANVAATLGGILLPFVLKAVSFFNKLALRFKELSPRTQKWLLILLGVAAAIGPLLIVLGTLAGAISALGPAIAVMLGPLGLVIALVALFALAYAKNWFGIRDITNKVVGKVVGLIKTLIKFFAIAFQDDPLNDWLTHIPKPLRGVVLFLGKLVHGVGEIIRAFRELRASGIDPLSAAFMALRRIFSQGTDELNTMTRAINTVESAVRFAIRFVGGLVDMAKRMIEAFGVNGISGVLALLAIKFDQVFGAAATGVFIRGIQSMIDLVMQFVDILKTTFQLIGALISGDWARAWELAKQLFQQFFTFLVDAFLLMPRHILDAFNAINWGAVGSLLLAGFLAALDFLADVGQRAWNFIKGQFDQIEWGNLISGAINALFDVGGDLIEGLWIGISAFWDDPVKPWLSDLASTAKALVPVLIDALFEKGQDLIRGLKNGLIAIWAEVTDWIAEIPGKVQTAAGDLTETLWEKGQDLIRGIKNGLISIWTDVTDWLAEIPGKAVAAVGDLLTTLLQHGKDLLSGLWSGAIVIWVELRTWMTEIPGKATTAVGDLTSTLLQKGKDLLQGMRDGWQVVWTLFSVTLANLGLAVTNKIGSLISTLLQKGKDLLNGLVSGIDNVAINVLWPKMTGLGGWIAGLVGSLGGVLYQAGKDLVQGLINGVSDRIPGLETVVNTVIGLWNRLPRTFRGGSPWKTMIGWSHDAMRGLEIGVQDRIPRLASTLRGVTDLIGDSFNVSAPGVVGMPALAGVATGSTAPTANSITINVNGAGDPRAVADEVFHIFNRELGLREGF